MRFPGLGFNAGGGLGVKVNLPLVADLLGRVSGGLSLSRASGQWFQDFEGKYRYAQPGEPALVGARRVENLLLNSEDFLGGNWLNSTGVTASKNTLTRTTTGNAYRGQAVAKIGAVQTYAASIIAAAGTGNFVALRLQGNYPARADVCFNLLTGAVSFPATAYGGFAVVGAAISLVSPGVYRCSLVATSDAKVNIEMFLSPRETSGVIDGADTGATASVRVTGSQLENVTGQSIQTPGEYVPTGSTTAARYFLTDLSGQSLLALGPELLAGGGFSSAAGWSLDAQWAISGGSANAVAAVNSQDVYQVNAVNLVAGKTYQVTHTVKNYAAGTVRFRYQKGAGPTYFLSGRSDNGTFTERFVAPDTGLFSVYWEGVAGGAFTGSVDDASIKEVLYPNALKGVLVEPGSTNKCSCYGSIPADVLGAELITNAADRDFSSDTGNWIKGTGVTISGGSLNFSGSAAGSTYYNPALVFSGRVYEFTYTVTVVSGSFNISCKGTAGATRNASGTFTERFIAGSVIGSGWYINTAAGNFNGSIDNVSVKEVQFAIGTKSYAVLGPELAINGGFNTDTDWVEGAGWSISGGVAVASSVIDTVPISEAIGTVGKQYQITYTIVSRTAGGFKAKCGTASGSYQQNPGTYTEILVCAGNGSLGVQASGTASGSIDNVSIKEVTWVQNLSGWSLGSNSDVAFAASIVDYTAAIAAASMQGLAPTGKAYRLDNSAGVTASYVIISGATGNINPHSYMIAAAVISGAPNIELTETGGSALYLSGAPLIFQKKENFVPASTTQKLQIRVPPGAVLVVLFPQLEELTFASSPMPTAGATATRAVTLLSFPTAGNAKTADFTVYLTITPLSVAAGIRQTVFTLGNDIGNDRFAIRARDLTTAQIQVAYGTFNGTSVQNLNLPAPVAGQTYKIAVSVRSSGVSASVNGAAVVSSPNAPTIALGGTASIGSSGGTVPFFGYVKDFGIIRRGLSDAQLMVKST